MHFPSSTRKCECNKNLLSPHIPLHRLCSTIHWKMDPMGFENVNRHCNSRKNLFFSGVERDTHGGGDLTLPWIVSFLHQFVHKVHAHLCHGCNYWWCPRASVAYKCRRSPECDTAFATSDSQIACHDYHKFAPGSLYGQPVLHCRTAKRYYKHFTSRDFQQLQGCLGPFLSTIGSNAVGTNIHIKQRRAEVNAWKADSNLRRSKIIKTRRKESTCQYAFHCKPNTVVLPTINDDAFMSMLLTEGKLLNHLKFRHRPLQGHSSQKTKMQTCLQEDKRGLKCSKPHDIQDYLLAVIHSTTTRRLE